MKKITLLAAVLVAVSFASCKKEAKCECTTSVTGMTRNGNAVDMTGYTQSSVTTTDISKTSKKNAASMCGGGTTTDTTTDTYTTGGGTITNTDVTTSSTTCSIK